MNVLHLTLKKKWFDMIASGEKTDEYREINPYWYRRLFGRWFDAVQFRNGYRPDSPTVTLEFKNMNVGRGLTEWGAPEDRDVFIISLGERMEGGVK